MSSSMGGSTGSKKGTSPGTSSSSTSPTKSGSSRLDEESRSGTTAFDDETSGAEWTSDRSTEHQEGDVAMAIEEQTAKMPSDWFLWAAIGAIGVSAMLQVSGQKERSNFVGQWAPTFLILGLYNKLVKVAGSDQLHR
jgi:hypothetical protein